MSKGLFITFEGIDGVGKSSQITRLGIQLISLGHKVHYTKEPGDLTMGSILGAGVRALVFGKNVNTKKLAPGAADMLFLADHIQNSYDVARLVDEEYTVICDRYADSQFAYAASETKACPAWALDLFEQRFGIVPDITILLLVHGIADANDIGWALERAQKRRGAEAGKQDAKAWNEVEEQLKVQHEYLDRLYYEPRTLPIWVRATDTEEQVEQAILAGVTAKLRNREQESLKEAA